MTGPSGLSLPVDAVTGSESTTQQEWEYAVAHIDGGGIYRARHVSLAYAEKAAAKCRATGADCHVVRRVVPEWERLP